MNLQLMKLWVRIISISRAISIHSSSEQQQDVQDGKLHFLIWTSLKIPRTSRVVSSNLEVVRALLQNAMPRPGSE